MERFNITKPILGIGSCATTLALLSIVPELRFVNTNQPLTDEWSQIPIRPRGSTLLGITFRPRQVDVFGLEMRSTLQHLLEYPIQLIRLGAFWNKIERSEEIFDTSELDWQIDAVEKAGVKIILCVGALKTFGYPEYFIPDYYMQQLFSDGTLITPSAHPELLDAASNFIIKIVDRYKDKESIIAWQLENEPADPHPLGHYWRISTEFVKQELAALRLADQTKPIVINGFFATSLPLWIAETWMTHDQGNSLALAIKESDLIGIDYYPRIAIASIASKSIYLNTTKVPWGQCHRRSLSKKIISKRKQLMVTEGQAEPWESTVVPDSPLHYAPYSCTPQDIIKNYNTWMCCAECNSLHSYLFWGAEYWILRWKYGDSEYLHAFLRVLEEA